jgi:SEC-C motif
LGSRANLTKIKRDCARSLVRTSEQCSRNQLSLHELARSSAPRRTPGRASWPNWRWRAGGRPTEIDGWMALARRLSLCLRSEEHPKLSQQREHFPPLGETWPFLPPRHVLWIDDVADTAILHVVLFGQLLGAVPINKAGEPSEYSAWRFNPEKRDFNHSSYPAIWHGTVAALATRSGRNVVSVVDAENSFTYIEDGPNGPMDIPALTLRADSPADALRVFAKHRGGGTNPTTNAEGNRLGPPGARTTGRNKPCPCGSGRKYKRCCG